MTQLLGIAGSLREKSYNKSLLAAAQPLMPEDTSLSVFDLTSIPLYNADRDTDSDRPQSVDALKDLIGKADGLLISTPEYNSGMPGVLKNAIDWASRPAFKSVLANKPVAVMGASPGQSGTMRAQQDVKAALMGCLSIVFPHRGVYVGSIAAKLDGDQLIDEKTKEYLQNFLSGYVEFISQVSGPNT